MMALEDTELPQGAVSPPNLKSTPSESTSVNRLFNLDTFYVLEDDSFNALRKELLSDQVFNKGPGSGSKQFS